MDAVTSFYERLITNTSPIEPVLQVRIIEHLVRTKEFALLGKLAARTDLSVEAEARVVSRNEAQVLAGWAVRPGRTHQELITRLAGEKRVSTLIPLAKMEGLPEEIYHEIGKRSSVKLTEALMTNPSVPAEIKLKLIDGIATLLDRKGSWYAAMAVEEAIGKDENLRRALAIHSCRSRVVVAALMVFPVELPKDLTANLIERLDLFVSSEASQNDQLAELLDRLAVQDLDAAQLKKLRPLVNRLAKIEKSSPSYWGTPSYDSPKHLLSEKGRATAARIRELASSTDATRSQKILTEILVSPKASEKLPYREAAYTALSANTVLPASLVQPYLEHFSGYDTDRVVRTWCARGEIKALAELAGDGWGEPEWLDSVADPRPILEQVVVLSRSRDEGLPHWLFTHPAVYTSPSTALMLLPWQSLHQVTSTPEFGADRSVDQTKRDLVVDAAQKLIAERMGTDPQKWEVFATLAGEFEGSLPELLDAVEAIAA